VLAVSWVCQLAAEFKQQFGRDVVVDIVGAPWGGGGGRHASRVARLVGGRDAGVSKVCGVEGVGRGPRAGWGLVDGGRAQGGGFWHGLSLDALGAMVWDVLGARRAGPRVQGPPDHGA
jgi:hypothetical protein